MTTPLKTTTKTIHKDDIINFTIKELSDTIKKGLNNKEEIITALSELFEETEIQQQQRDLQQVYILIEKKITFEDDEDYGVENDKSSNEKEEQQQNKKVTENVNELLATFGQIKEKIKQLQKRINKLEGEKKSPSPSPSTDDEYINIKVIRVGSSEIYFRIKKITVLGTLMSIYRSRFNIPDGFGSFIHKGRLISLEKTGEELGFGESEDIHFIETAPTTHI